MTGGCVQMGVIGLYRGSKFVDSVKFVQVWQLKSKDHRLTELSSLSTRAGGLVLVSPQWLDPQLAPVLWIGLQEKRDVRFRLAKTRGCDSETNWL